MKFVTKIFYYHRILEQLPKPAQWSVQSCLLQCYWHGYPVYMQIEMEMSGCSLLLREPLSLVEVLITRISFFVSSWNLLLSIQQHRMSFSCHMKGLQMFEMLSLKFFFLSREQILYWMKYLWGFSLSIFAWFAVKKFCSIIFNLNSMIPINLLTQIKDKG